MYLVLVFVSLIKQGIILFDFFLFATSMSTPTPPPLKSAKSLFDDSPKSVTKFVIWPPKHRPSNHGDDSKEASTSNTTSNIEINVETEELNHVAVNHDAPSNSDELDENTSSSREVGENNRTRIGSLGMWSFEACELANRFAYGYGQPIKTSNDYIAEKQVINRVNSEEASIVKRDRFGREIEVNDNWLVNFKNFRLSLGYD